MTAAWPGTIPATPILGFTEQRQRNVTTFQPDVGSPKMSRRSTAVTYNCVATFKMTDAELASFNTFYETTLQDGTLPFTWAHPRTSVSYTWVFHPEDSPNIEVTNYDHNTVNVKLVRLP